MPGLHVLSSSSQQPVQSLLRAGWPPRAAQSTTAGCAAHGACRFFGAHPLSAVHAQPVDALSLASVIDAH
eukprot:1160136-Pelagomonas_calceolata.AAC.6